MNSILLSLPMLLRIIAVIALQAIFFNHVTLFNLAKPFFYILLLLYLPISTTKWVSLVYAFIIGFTIDIFYGTWGLHSAACVFVIFIRDTVLHTILGVDPTGIQGKEPHLSLIGLSTFMVYAATLTFFHHLIFFLLDAFSFREFFFLFFKVIINTFFTILLIMMIEILFFYGYKSK